MSSRSGLRVWFNQGLSSVYDALEIIRGADRKGQLTLLASYALAVSPLQIAAQETWPEPARHLCEDEYIDWCLRTCAEKEVDLFVPGRKKRGVAGRLDEFERRGTRVLVAARPEILDLLDRKDRLYADLAGTAVPVADFRAIRTGEELAEAYRFLGERHAEVCIKPARAIFGAGFHLLDADDDEYKRFVTSDVLRVGVDAFRRALAKTRQPLDLLVMEYLPGSERSIDCLARDGRLIAAVARVKHEGFQELESGGAAIDLAAILTERYGLNGVFNVQTRDTRGVPHLLEVNPRMSGGILYSCFSGLALPYWAVMLALGLCDPEEIPTPRGKVVVAPVTAAVAVAGHR